MARSCSVCTHPQQQQIDRELIALELFRRDCKDVLGYVTIEPADETGFVPYAAYAAVRNPDASQEKVITSTLTYS